MKPPSRSRAPGRPSIGQPIYRRIADDLRKKIIGGTPAKGAALPSLRRLASTYQVTPTTMRWALEVLRKERLLGLNPRGKMIVRDRRNSTEVTRFQVLQVVAGFLNDEVNSRDFMALQRGVLSGIGSLRGSLLIANHPQLKYALPEDVLGGPLAGILLFGHYQASTLKEYERLSLPVVRVDRPARSALHSVSVDNERAAYDATARLIALGHRRIAFFRVIRSKLLDVDPDAKERQEGYLRALAEHKLPHNADLVFSAMGRDETPARAILRERPRITAVLASDPQRAYMVEREAQAAGCAIPGDLSIACFQGSNPERPQFSGPRVDFEKVGCEAVRLLSLAPKGVQAIRIPAPWVEGRTTRAPAGPQSSARR